MAGSFATAIGTNAMQYSNNTSTPFDNRNVAVGFEALRGSTTASANTGNSNIALGSQSLLANTTGNYNVATGQWALSSNTTGSSNIATGQASLFLNTTGSSNISIGTAALYSNVAGFNATAVGYNAMFYANNTSTQFTNTNVAVGFEALRGSTTASANTGIHNTALGYQTLFSNSGGDFNVSIGHQALYSNASGVQNIGIGGNSLRNNLTGGNNVALGVASLQTNLGDNNVAIGAFAGYTTNPANANITGSNNIFIGYNSGPGTSAQLTNATAIGYNAKVATSNSIVLGGTGADAVKVGIGTTSPSITLDVVGTDAAKMPIGTTAQRPSSPAAGMMRYNSTENTMEYYNGTNWFFVAPKIAFVKDSRGSGTDGGASIAGYQARTFDNAVIGDLSVVTLAPPQFTLGSGEYIIEASAPAYQTGYHKIRLYNITSSIETMTGSSERASSADQTITRSHLITRFTLTSSTLFEIQHYCNLAALEGLGQAVGAGSSEVYTQIKITKLR